MEKIVTASERSTTLSYYWRCGQQNRQAALNVGRHLTMCVHSLVVRATPLQALAVDAEQNHARCVADLRCYAAICNWQLLRAPPSESQ